MGVVLNTSDQLRVNLTEVLPHGRPKASYCGKGDESEKGYEQRVLNQGCTTFVAKTRRNIVDISRKGYVCFPQFVHHANRVHLSCK